MGLDLDSMDPCCGIPLKRGTKVIAMMDMVMAVATACFAAFGMFITLFFSAEIQEALEKDKAEFPDEAEFYDYLGSGVIVSVLLLAFISALLHFLLAQHLMNGAKQRDVSKITTWFKITSFLLVLRGFFYFMGILTAAEPTAMIFFGLLGFAYSSYSLFVVYRFRQELTTEESYILKGQTAYPVYKL